MLLLCAAYQDQLQGYVNNSSSCVKRKRAKYEKWHIFCSIFSYFNFSVTLIWWNDYLLRRLGSTRTPSPSKSVWVKLSKKELFFKSRFCNKDGSVSSSQVKNFHRCNPIIFRWRLFFWLGLWSGKRSDEATWSEPVRGRDTGHGQPGESGQWTCWMWGRYLTGHRDPV